MAHVMRNGPCYEEWVFYIKKDDVFWRRLVMTGCFCKADELEWYRRQGLNLWPRGYQPRALPLRHPGYVCAVFCRRLAVTDCFCKAAEL